MQMHGSTAELAIPAIAAAALMLCACRLLDAAHFKSAARAKSRAHLRLWRGDGEGEAGHRRPDAMSNKDEKSLVEQRIYLGVSLRRIISSHQTEPATTASQFQHKYLTRRMSGDERIASARIESLPIRNLEIILM